MISVQIRELRERKGWTQKELAEAAGVSIGAIRDYEQNRRQAPTFLALKRLATALGVEVSVFHLGNDVSPRTALPQGRPRTVIPFEVPLSGTVAAGHPIEVVETGDRLSFAELFGGEGVFALRVAGNSMIEAAICDGDYVLIRGGADAQNGETVVAEVDGCATLKVIQRRPRELLLLPRSEHEKPLRVARGSPVRILGALIGVIRRVR